MNKYILNLETGKIELHFVKADYLALTDGLKAELKRFFLWSGKAGAWVSRSKNNHYMALQIAKKLGFIEEERKGARLSYAEELENKANKAEARAERFEGYAANASNRAEVLQGEFNSLRKDIAFITQPIIRGHSGSEAFGRRRQRIMDRYDKGIHEYRKSDYFKEKAAAARAAANMNELKNKVYLNNRIEECKAVIRDYEKRIIRLEDSNFNKNLDEQTVKYFNDLLEKLEYQVDKLAFFENCLDEIGGIAYSKENVKKSYLIKVRGRWAKVEKANVKTVSVIYIEAPLLNLHSQITYAEIQDLKIPEGWTEKEQETVNPFTEGDILTRSNISGNRIIAAYQVSKVTKKTIIIREIRVDNNIPVVNDFIGDKEEKRTVKKDRSGNYVVNDGSWYLYKYCKSSIPA